MASNGMRTRIGRKETGELPSMGAAVAECGRSLSAWDAKLTTGGATLASLDRVVDASFRQVGAGSA
jgi:hypothetical protein